MYPENPNPVSQILKQSLEDLYQWAAANQVEIEIIQKDSEADFKRRQKNISNPRTNETSRLANDYRMMAMSFKSANKRIIESFKPDTAEQAIAETELVLKTIGWYEVQLPVHITHAYVGLAEFVETTTDAVQNEFNASASEVLTGIEASFRAWETLIRLIPEQENSCRQAMLLLDRIQKRILADFPNAHAFIKHSVDALNSSRSLSRSNS